MGTECSKVFLPSAERRRQRGLTMLELLIAVFIVSLLAMVALPSYRDYMVRTEVGKDFNLVGKAKTSISAYYAINERLPRSNKEAGLDDWSFANFKLYVGSFGGYDATIILVYNSDEIPELDGWEILVFHATEVNGHLTWDCTKDGSMPNRYRPSVCRG